jgi:phosphate starvation-inducible protein PhoH and related proteins
MELSVTLLEPQRRGELFGAGDRNLRRIRDALNVRIQARNDVVKILGEPADVSRAPGVVERLQKALRSGAELDDEFVDSAIGQTNPPSERPDVRGGITVFTRDIIAPRTEGQRHYVEAMFNHDMVFCLGPAGTGKTYLAVALAVHMLKNGQVKRIALVRPAVEAGEKLGFLPGDIQAKVNPYLRPLLDAMHDMMSFEQVKRFMVNDVVELVPLAYMRGRTLNHAAIILDEAQNTTPVQMLMFLTRMGQGSKMIITGDDSQVDLAPGQPSGLVDAVRRLRNVPGISIMRLDQRDIVRHRLVQEIVTRYAPGEAREATISSPRGVEPEPPVAIPAGG